MQLNVSILDFLASGLCLSYVSDLRFLSKGQKKRAAYFLMERVPVEAADLREWNDALGYLTNQGPVLTAAEARQRLIDGMENAR